MLKTVHRRYNFILNTRIALNRKCAANYTVYANRGIKIVL